ncbi:hypothetical protein [uncultured Metabacillus sp.]|uniref:hypothetical protein n=1 Tax=Metabacillus sp. Hm71 TaxID=3450743 RepID=UPI002633B906|nr:hypothetical protein [uncultured Metabacillus sp.]
MDYKITDDITKASHWLAKVDENNHLSDVRVGVFYPLEYDQIEDEYFIVDDKGVASLIFLGHEGDYVYFEG